MIATCERFQFINAVTVTMNDLHLFYKINVLFPESPTPSNGNFTTLSLALAMSSLSILSLRFLAAEDLPEQPSNILGKFTDQNK